MLNKRLGNQFGTKHRPAKTGFLTLSEDHNGKVSTRKQSSALAGKHVHQE